VTFQAIGNLPAAQIGCPAKPVDIPAAARREFSERFGVTDGLGS
jgi:hypothetical protein